MERRGPATVACHAFHTYFPPSDTAFGVPKHGPVPHVCPHGPLPCCRWRPLSRPLLRLRLVPCPRTRIPRPGTGSPDLSWMGNAIKFSSIAADEVPEFPSNPLHPRPNVSRLPRIPSRRFPVYGPCLTSTPTSPRSTCTRVFRRRRGTPSRLHMGILWSPG